MNDTDTGDSDAGPYYSLSDDAYSDNFSNKNSSFDNDNVSALNKPHVIDFNIEKDNRKPKSRRRETAVPSE